jgi:hypothetical protein
LRGKYTSPKTSNTDLFKNEIPTSFYKSHVFPIVPHNDPARAKRLARLKMEAACESNIVTKEPQNSPVQSRSLKPLVVRESGSLSPIKTHSVKALKPKAVSMRSM